MIRHFDEREQMSDPFFLFQSPLARVERGGGLLYSLCGLFDYTHDYINKEYKDEP